MAGICGGFSVGSRVPALSAGKIPSAFRLSCAFRLFLPYFCDGFTGVLPLLFKPERRGGIQESLDISHISFRGRLCSFCCNGIHYQPSGGICSSLPLRFSALSGRQAGERKGRRKGGGKWPPIVRIPCRRLISGFVSCKDTAQTIS